MSSNDLLSKFDDLVKRFREEFGEIVEAERAKMKAEIEAYNAEKQRMKAADVSDDDIIRLNIGGQKLTTARSTLCQVEGSLLATMFSGRWEDSLKRDEDGAVFFDFNPLYFGFILDYLRAKKIATPESPAPLPKVPDDQMKHFTNLLEYLGLADEIVPTEIAPDVKQSEKFNLCSPEITLQEEKKVAVHDSNAGHRHVLGENIYQRGIVHFKLKLESFQNNHWVMVGIVRADVVPQLQSRSSYGWPGSIGWALGYGGQVYKDGSSSINDSLRKLSKQGDTVELVLDCDAGKLSLHLPTGHQFHIEIPKPQTWRLHVNLHGANDKIRIVEVTQT
ncbi:Chaperone dnaK2 [Paramuricea clavata]|uniref:Chaperone dnaK2 n=1 Tax=Paramuricea clavata TaxID=317549 RepID=A0A7D9IIW2_PARCT|nr:Chaperone dnaK2 [Paramuricea clavata]